MKKDETCVDSVISLAFIFIALAAHAQQPPIPPAQSALGQHGMVVAQEARAAQIGVDVLKRGGNAVDAAVAVGFAMAVTYPVAGNLGGGGFMVIHLAKGNRNTAIDYRETAPAAASKTMFLDADGKPDPAKSRDSGLAVGVPGTVAGLALAEKKYGSGKFTLAELIAPAIKLAREGFPGRRPCRRHAAAHEGTPGALAVVGAIFFNNGEPLKEGDRLVQPDLAKTLQAIARTGPTPSTAAASPMQIAAAVREAGGIMTADDLEHYRAVERAADPRQLSRLRYRLHAAALLRRRDADRDAQHSGRLRSRQARPHRAGLARSDRGDEARLCRPRRLSRRSGVR